MIFKCQERSLIELQKLADSDRHSILIEGSPGSGKTYLARQYANMLKIPDFDTVAPKVSDIRESVDRCHQLDNNVVLCIENLDKGVSSSSYTLLKCLEEPLPNMYIVITCRNINNVPDTIISRSTVVSACPPTDSDIDLFSRSVNPDRYLKINQSVLWKCVRTLNDANLMLSLSDEKLSYIESLQSMSRFNDSISNIVWKLGHFEDKSETPIELVIRYLMEIINTPHVRMSGIECISDLTLGRIASHAILAKFAFECKYCE